MVERTLDSVLHQSYADIEHLIIDGASKDDTMDKVAIYKDKVENARNGRYPDEANRHRVIVTSERDNGLYDAMNKGIAKATGDYIIFLNAGDRFHSDDTLQKVAESLSSSKAGKEEKDDLPGVIYGETDIVDDAGNFIRHRRLAAPEHLTWRSFRHGMLVCHQSFYARTDIARNIPYSMDYRVSADVDWCISIMHECERKSLSLHNTHLTLTSYLDGGLSIKNHRKSLKERFLIMAKHYGWLQTIGMHCWFVLRAFVKK